MKSRNSRRLDARQLALDLGDSGSSEESRVTRPPLMGKRALAKYPPEEDLEGLSRTRDGVPLNFGGMAESTVRGWTKPNRKE